MNIYQKLLFARVGFTPAVLQMFNEHCGDKLITERTARYWASGEKEPRNPYYLTTAQELDEYLTDHARYIISSHDGDRFILPYYANDDEYWVATGDMPCPVAVYHQLLQRITMFSDKPVHYLLDPNGGLDDDDYNSQLRQDWDNYINLAVGFDFGEKVTLQDVCVICGEPRSPRRRELCSSDECRRELARQKTAEWRENLKNNPEKYQQFLADNAKRTNRIYHDLKENHPEKYKELREKNSKARKKTLIKTHR